MSLISSSIPNLVNGVSQQPYTLRLSSQAEAQENGYSTVAKGLKKRPPTRHIAKLTTNTLDNAYLHTINRDSNERYVVAMLNGNLMVWDINGNAKTVSFPNGKAYLTTATPNMSMRTITVADYTFIVNKEVQVKASTTLTTTRNPEALVQVKAGNYGKTYSININGSQVASFTTRDGSDKSHVVDLDTDTIASNLQSGITAAGFTVVRYGSVLHIKSQSSADFTIQAFDGYNNAGMVALKGAVQRFSDLPSNAGADGFTIEVTGDSNSGFDNYWVKFSRTTADTGVWKETVEPGISVGLDASTMPHGLIRNSDGTFTFKQLGWKQRVAGDLNSAPDPSFVGRKLQDVFFYRNRLGLLSDDSVIFSEAGEFFNFYNPTSTALLDSAPIDASVSHTKVSTLVHAVPFAKQLLLFSEQTQFVVESGDLLTPKTISIKQTTEFECNTTAKPIGVGNTVYFAVPRGEYSGVREFFVDSNTGANDATDVTAHVPTYIPSNITRIVAGLNEDIVVCYTPEEPQSLFVYKFYWNENRKLQSSWSKWVFNGDRILNIDFIESTLYMVIQRADGTYIESLKVANIQNPDQYEPYIIHLDRKAVVVMGNSDGVKTYMNLPYPLGSQVLYAVAADTNGTLSGSLMTIKSDAGGYYIDGAWAGAKMVVGRTYSFKYQLSTVVIKKQQGDAQVADTTGRLQLRSMSFNYADTGSFKVTVKNEGRTSYNYEFTSQTLGDVSATLGATYMKTGRFKFPVMGKSDRVTIEVTSDSPKPVSLLNAEWEGYYVRRSTPA